MTPLPASGIHKTPRLVSGVKVIALDSSAITPTYLLIHPGGRRWEIAEPLKQLLAAIDGVTETEAIALAVSGRTGGELTGARVHSLIWGFLLDARIVEATENPEIGCHDSGSRAGRRNDLLCRVPLLRGRWLRVLTGILQILCFPSVAVVLASAALLLQCFWFVSQAASVDAASRGSWEGGQFFVLECVIASFVLHELGHCSACHRLGSSDGEIGFGIYLCFPVLYSDVTYAWTLPRMQRAMIDLSGIYFQLLASAALLARYTFTGYRPELWAAIAITISALPNLDPFLKLDGYWFLSDVLGVPNLWSRLRDVLAGDTSVVRRFGRGAKFSVYAYSFFTLLYLFWFVYNVARYVGSLIGGQYARLLSAFWLSLKGGGASNLHAVFESLVALATPTAIIVSLPFLAVRYAKLARQ